MTLSFKVPSQSDDLVLRLVATYSGTASSINSTVSTDVTIAEFADADGRSVQGLATACTHTAQSSPLSAQLLGETPEIKSKILEWQTFAVTELTSLLDDKLAKVNDWLATRTFLAGNQITVADLMVYAAVSPAVVCFPVAQHGHFCNLMRWYDYIHAVADTASLFPPIPKFEKSKLVPPPAPAPAAPKENGKASTATPKDNEVNAAPTTAVPIPDTGADGKKEKKQEKKKDASSAPAPETPAQSSSSSSPANTSAAAAAAPPSDGPTVDVLDLRIGVITKVGPHPNADSLYLEEIDLGESEPRQVVSGLRKFVPEDKMQNRRVVVVCNLKPAKMRDIMSYGMVLCASNDDHTQVDPIIPPEGAAIGERITFEGYNGQPEAQLNPKKKIFEKIAPDLITDGDGLCTYKGVPFMTSAGPVKASLPGAHIA